MPRYIFYQIVSILTLYSWTVYGSCGCQNGGICLSSGACLCIGGYEGSICETDIDECSPSLNICDQMCTNTPGSFSCSCNPGYALASNAISCQDVNECLGTNSCSAHSTCYNTEGSYQCICNSPYVGDGFTCEDLNECAATPSPCDHNCNNTLGSFECSCNTGYALQSDQTTCIDIDECSESNSCSVNATCTNTPGSYQCTCNTPYVGNGFLCEEPASDHAVSFHRSIHRYCIMLLTLIVSLNLFLRNSMILLS